MANIDKIITRFEGRAPLVQGTAYNAASHTDRALAKWTPYAGSANADLIPELDTLRPRSRDLTRNHGLARGAYKTMLDMVIGPGLRLSAKPDYRALGKSKDWAVGWARDVEAAWRSWAETPDCDVEEELSFPWQTRLMYSSSYLNGDGLALAYWITDRGTRYRTRLGIFEADRLSNPDEGEDEDFLKGGIEVDRYGRRVAYHIRKKHPGDDYTLTGGGGEWERVPAKTSWGRRQVIHLYHKERPGQKRGAPDLSAVIPQFKMMDHYQKTELQAAIVNAMIAAFIETPMASEDLVELFGGDPNNIDPTKRNRVPLRGGSVIALQPGEKLSTFNPNRPAGNFAPFIEAVVAQIAPGLDLSPELLLKDFRKSNYSSIRGMLVEIWRHVVVSRGWTVSGFCQPGYELWFEDAASLGIIDAPDLYKNFYAYTRSTWIGPGRGWIDQVKEAQGAKLRVDSNMSTLEREGAEQGLDYEEVLDQRATEKKMLEEKGLSEASAESWVTGNGTEKEGG